MVELLFFALGIMFSFVVVPMFQVISDLLFAVSELLVAKASVSIAKSNAKVRETIEQLEQEDTYAIGFNTSYEYEDDEFFDEE